MAPAAPTTTDGVSLRRQVAIGLVGATLLIAAGACTTKSLDVEAGSPSTDQRTTATEREDATSTTRSVPSSTTPTTVAAAPTEGEPSDSPVGEPGSRAGQCPSEAAVNELQGRVGGVSGDIPPADVMSAILDLLALYVPSDLAADFEVMRGAIMQMIAAFGIFGPDAPTMSPEQLEELGATLEAIDTPEINAASRRIEDYFKQTCPDLDWDGTNLDHLEPTFD